MRKKIIYLSVLFCLSVAGSRRSQVQKGNPHFPLQLLL